MPTFRTLDNKLTYESADVVRAYSIEKFQLQKPESSIIEVLKNELPAYSMLDIGVGGGRTTHFFAPRVRKYVGIDYSPPMIEQCRRRFSLDFRICDARDMQVFPDSSFDFVLFSYNGIDYMGHNDRLGTLSEIRRVIRSRGKFCFSTHNLNYVPELFSLYMLHPRVLLHAIKVGTVNRYPRMLLHAIKVRTVNRSLTSRKRFSQFALLNDGARSFRLLTYYIDPSEQLKQLKELGFEDVRAFGLDGTMISASRLQKANDSWIYYLCEKNSDGV